MKKLIAIGALCLVLSFPTLTFAFDHMGLYTEPIVRSEVKNEINGGTVEKDYISFYISPKEVNTAPRLIGYRKSDKDKDYIVVFGVRIPLSPET